MTETPRLPVPLLDGQRAQEHDDLTREATEVIRAWIAKRAIICNHTQVLEYPEAADELMKVFGARIGELRDQYERLFDIFVRRTEEWQGELAARVEAEQATIAADQRARQAETERDAARAELEERGKALADWQRVAGQHQAALFDAKNRAEQLDKAVTFLTEVLAGTVLLGADDAIGMLHELVTVLRDTDDITAEQATQVRAGLNAQRANRDQLRQLVRDLTDPDPCDFDHRGGCQAHGYLDLKPGEKCPHAEAKELLGADDTEREGGGHG